MIDDCKDMVITFKDGDIAEWDGDQYDDYSYEGAVFVVKKNGEWVGIYDMDSVSCIEIGLYGYDYND